MKKILSLLLSLSFIMVFSMNAIATTEDAMQVKKQYKKFAPVRIKVDPTLLTKRQKMLVDELVAAADYMDKIFLIQVFKKNPKIQAELKKAGGKKKVIYDYFKMNFGPFDRLDHDKPFIKGVGKKPLGANYYPEDMTKKDFENWIKKHPSDSKMFESNFTVIRRNGKKLEAIPYSEAYKEYLVPAAKHLKAAAKYTDNKSLKKYLNSRADAFLSNDYYQSDVDWVRLKDHAIEVVIGPYEVYEDQLFGYKAAFESFITRVDPIESRRLDKIVDFLDDMERNLPIDDKHKGIGRSLTSPLIVAYEIYTAGDTRAGIQTIAFNLPNDEKVRKYEGSKKVMLKNVLEAKFNKILKPIARKVLDAKDCSNVDFDAFFAHVLLHEISHGIGPGEIKKGRRHTTVNKELKEQYSVIEEAKADTLSTYNNLFLIEKGIYPKDFEKVLWPTYLAGIFRSVRFGIGEAHGGANAVQFNYLLDNGAVIYNEKSGKFSIDREKIGPVMKELVQNLLMIEAKGDYSAAKAFVETYRKMPKCMKDALAKLKSVPVDIRPIYSYKPDSR